MDEMGDGKTENSLHLPNLRIENFRGIDSLTIPQLGRVTLIAGKNSVGKTTVLEAVQAYAARGRYAVLSALLQGREEMSPGIDEDGDSVSEIDWSTLFYGRDPGQPEKIAIGPTTSYDQLFIEKISLTEEQSAHLAERFPQIWINDHSHALKIVWNGNVTIVPWMSLPGVPAVFLSGTRVVRSSPRVRPGFRSAARGLRKRPGLTDRRILSEFEPIPAISCESLGPGVITNAQIARFWDRVALTDHETHAVKALSLIFGGDIDGVAMIGEDSNNRLRSRRAIVKLKNQGRPVPLRSLGDGAQRLFGAALALANCQGGFLLIDEAENGIHHSVQHSYWRMVLQTAQENNVQVIATTHSWDCVSGFARAASESESVEGVLVRLERNDVGLRAVSYSEENLRVAAEQEIEVR